jgi:hypothetical protein
MRNRTDRWCVERAMGALGDGVGQTRGRLGTLAAVGHPALLIAAGVAALLALGVAASFGLLTPRSGMSRRGALRRNLGLAALHRSAGEVRPTLTWAAHPPAPDPAEPDPAEPDPAEPDPAEPDPAEPDPAEPDRTEPNPTDPEPAEPQAPTVSTDRTGTG